jgi:hypothetical protein
MIKRARALIAHRKSRPRYIGSKWVKTKALLRSADLRRYVPETAVLSRSSLRSLLDRYGMAYVKPDFGTGGRGVMRTEKLRIGARTAYRYQILSRSASFGSFDGLYASVLRSRVKRKYLAQQGIRMLKYRNRPFDLRVMVQHNPEGHWETTGIIGRVAHPSRIVTNFHDRGTPTPVGALLSPHLPDRTARERQISRLRTLGLNIARQMGKVFPGVREVGVDVALDRKLHPWVLEVNTRPDPYIFNRLKDKRMFRRIIACAKANGRL